MRRFRTETPPILAHSLALLAGLATAATGAEVTAPTPRANEPVLAPGGAQPPALDAATTHRAEQAADAYLKAEAARDAHADPTAERALADAEVELLTAQTFLDQQLPLKAGERYLEASKLLTGISPEDRLALGARFHRASAALIALSRRLLGDHTFDLGPPEQAGAPGSAPAGGPAGGSTAAPTLRPGPTTAAP